MLEEVHVIVSLKDRLDFISTVDGSVGKRYLRNSQKFVKNSLSHQ